MASLRVAPFAHFVLEAEVSADTADNRWPEIGSAVNDSSNLRDRKTLSAVHWQPITFEPFKRI